MTLPTHQSDNATRETMPALHWRTHVLDRTGAEFRGQKVPVDDDRRYIDVGEWLRETQSERLAIQYNVGETVRGSVEMMVRFVSAAIQAGHDESMSSAVRACRRALR